MANLHSNMAAAQLNQSTNIEPAAAINNNNNTENAQQQQLQLQREEENNNGALDEAASNEQMAKLKMRFAAEMLCEWKSFKLPKIYSFEYDGNLNANKEYCIK